MGEPIGPAAGSCGTAVYLKQPVLVSDIASDPLWAEYRELAAQAGLRSCWSVPILSDQDTALGSLAVYSHAVRAPTDHELEAMLGASHLARIAIERKVADERVRESEQQFRSAFEGAATGIAFVGFDGTFLRVNPALCELVGYRADELIGSNYRDVTHPDDVDLSEETGNLVADGLARSVDFEKRYIHRDGHVVWVQMTSSVIRDDAGKALYHITQMHDVTPRKRVEEALRQSEQRFRGLIQHATDMIGIVDASGIIVYESPALQRTLGFQVDDVVGRNFSFLVHPHDLENSQVVFTALLKQPDQHMPITFRCRHIDGSWRWLEATVANLLDEPGVQGLVINARDVTDRVLAESLIRESEERFRSAFEDASIGMAIMGMDDTIQRVNNALCEFSGYSAHELTGLKGAELSHPEDAGTAVPQMGDLLNGTIKSVRVERRYSHRDGSTIWALVNMSAVMDESGKPSYLIAQIQDITERKALEESLHHQAFHDMLTGLPNRALLLERIRVAITQPHLASGFVGLLYLDLDNFKIVNDSLGHLAGDKLLMQLAERLQACVREGDTVSRLGGDEFAILLPSLTSVSEALDIADRVVAAFEQPLVVVGRSINASTSIGVVIAEPEDTPDDLLRQADVAMYRAKARGKNCIELFDAEMHADALRRLEVENDLRRAIEQREFVVHYQPKVDLHEQRVYGLEALVRWNHPVHGLLPPARFISLAEETGLIVPLGRFVLHEVCQQTRRLLDAGLLQHDSVMSLNISSRQFADPGLVDDVAEAMAAARLNPGKLILEMTETVLMDDVEESSVRLEALAALGVGIAIDDFGTGYSSLSYLRRFPISVLKIDRSFVSRLGISTADTAIVTAIISLADALLVHAVAEGVETVEQLEHLQRLGCHLAQGFYFSRPLPVSELETFLKTGIDAWAAYI